MISFHISAQDTGTCKEEENKIDQKKKKKKEREPVAVAQTPAISVRLCCHVAYGTRQTVSLFPSCLCLLRDDRSKSTFRPSSRHQEDLAVIWGEKG